MLYRLKQITMNPQVAAVGLTTTPAAAGFFEKQGFHIVRREGSEVELVKRLTVCE